MSAELHNKLAPELVRRIVEPVLESGGDQADILVVLESVCAGVIWFCAKKNAVSRDVVFDALIDAVRGRLDTMS